MNYSLPYKRIFGGVSSMRSDQFKRINGYPNRYWGWGGKVFFVDIFQILSKYKSNGTRLTNDFLL